MKHTFFGALKKGLFALAPLLLTVALLHWIYKTLESAFGSFLEMIVGNKWYFPGLGIIMAVLVVALVGYLLDYLLIQKVYHWGEKVLTRIPLVKTFYGSLRQFLKFFKQDDKKLGQAVRVKMGEQHMIGIMTRTDLNHSPIAKPDEVAVFFPMSYQMGGYTMLVRHANIEKINMNVEDVLKFAVTAGVLDDVKQ